MQQLTAADTAFLTMETATQFGHVGSLSIFEPGATYDRVVARIEERLHLIPPYRRRLVEVPFGFDRPYWIEDPDFDLDFHVRHIAVPPPGTREKLAELVARLSARPMDRSRPLWEWYVIEGLESGEVAHYAKTHHATIDGASGTELMTVLLDDSPEGRTVAPPEREWKPDPVPTDVELMMRQAANFARRPEQFARAQLRLTREMMARVTDEASQRNFDQAMRQFADAFPWAVPRPGARRDRDLPSLPTTAAPRTPFNASITPHRRWAFCTLSLTDAKRVKNAHGVTLNDVVLAICSGALRRYLEEENALPGDSLIAMCPVSIRTGAETETYSNRVSGMMAALATDIDDPVERLRAINRSTLAAKEQFNAIPADALQDFTQFAPPALAAQASRVMASLRIADRMNPPFNLIISNVPGPRSALYLGGAMLKHILPVSTVADGMGLNMTVISYLDNLDFGSIACRELVPGLWRLNDHLPAALGELLARSA